MNVNRRANFYIALGAATLTLASSIGCRPKDSNLECDLKGVISGRQITREYQLPYGVSRLYVKNEDYPFIEGAYSLAVYPGALEKTPAIGEAVGGPGFTIQTVARRNQGLIDIETTMSRGLSNPQISRWSIVDSAIDPKICNIIHTYWNQSREINVLVNGQVPRQDKITIQLDLAG